MDVIIAYLYGDLNKEIYMKLPNDFKLPEELMSKTKSIYSIKLQRSLYGLKKFRHIWYNRLNKYLQKQGFQNNEICPCIYIRASSTGFVLIVVYVDDLNII